MEIIAGLSALLGSSAIGTLIGGAFAFLHKKQDATIEMQMRDRDIELAKIEATSQQSVRIEESEVARFNALANIEQADALNPGMLKSAGSFGFLYVLSDVLRRSIRPLATIALLSSALWISWYLLVTMDSWSLLGTEEKYQLAMQCMNWVFGQASAVIAFWFVSRGAAK
jgi:hypothetical protein